MAAAEILGLAQQVPPISPSMAGGAVYERFETEPDTMALAVVDADGRPVGIVERNQFFLCMAAQYGRQLYGQRPISLIMNPAPLVAEGDTPVDEFCGRALAERPSELLQGFIVTRGGRYAGVGSALSLLQATSAANRAHAEEMTRLAGRLAAAQEAAQASLKAKGQFLATMSHEIRTPLNGILAIADILGRKLPSEDLRAYVATISDSGQTLMRLLNDALDLSRADAGRLALMEQAFCVPKLLHDLEALWLSRVEQKGLTISLTYEGEADLWALGDAVRLKQVFNNLISNALKFTDVGGVDVRIGCSTTGQGLRLEGAVRDSGVGIPDDFLPRMFAPFNQTDEGMARGGAGLGLSVCREIVLQMGGAIGARRNPDAGSTVWFDALLQPAEETVETEGAEHPEASADWGLSILVADDNATNRLVASTLCDLIGCSCETVNDGLGAVEAAARGAFDLILMDIKMPRLDGVGAMRRIRATAKGADVPIIALTANADPEDAAGYLAAGMTGVVPKPIKAETLYAAIRAAVSPEAASPALELDRTA